MMEANDIDPAEPASVRLARSRAELKSLFEPQEPDAAKPRVKREDNAFPRSWTMRMLTKGAGAGGFAVLATALFATSPAKAVRLLRYLPVNAITKILVAKMINAQGAKK